MIPSLPLASLETFPRLQCSTPFSYEPASSFAVSIGALRQTAPYCVVFSRKHPQAAGNAGSVYGLQDQVTSAAHRRLLLPTSRSTR